MPIMNLVLFECEWFDNTLNVGIKVDNMYGIVQVNQSRRYNKAYDPFIIAQQAEQVYYTSYPEGHQGWLGVIKTKARCRISDNIVSQVEHETPYQDDELIQLQVVLHVDPDFIYDSLAHVDSEGEEIDMQLLNQTNMDEEYEDEYISSEGDMDSDFDETYTSSIIHALQLIAYLVLIIFYINSPISPIHPTTMEFRRPIYEGPSLPIVEEEHAKHLIEVSIPTSFSIETTLNQPLPTHDSLTPECESDNVIDHRPWLHAKKGE